MVQKMKQIKHLGWNVFKKKKTNTAVKCLCRTAIDEVRGRTALAGLDNVRRAPVLLAIRITPNRDQANCFGSGAHRWMFRLSGICYGWEGKRGTGLAATVRCHLNCTQKMRCHSACSVVSVCFAEGAGLPAGHKLHCFRQFLNICLERVCRAHSWSGAQSKRRSCYLRTRAALQTRGHLFPHITVHTQTNKTNKQNPLFLCFDLWLQMFLAVSLGRIHNILQSISFGTVTRKCNILYTAITRFQHPFDSCSPVQLLPLLFIPSNMCW